MQNPPAAGPPAATTTSAGVPLALPGTWAFTTAEASASRCWARRATNAGRQFARCFARWPCVLEHVRLVALRALAVNRPVDPNDPDVWRSRDEHAQAVLRRHGLAQLSAGRLTLAAINELIAGQARADRDAGLDWSTVTAPPAWLDERLRRANADAADLARRASRVRAPRRSTARAVANARRIRRAGGRPVALGARPPRRVPARRFALLAVGSRTWLLLCDAQLPAVDRVQRPVGLFVLPAAHATDGWQLTPVLSLEVIRLLASLGGRLERDLRSAVLPAAAVPPLLERLNPQTLHAGPKECLDSAGQLSQGAQP